MPDTGLEYLSLFGLLYDDPKITKFLESQPAHRADKPSDGSQYILCKEGGFDLLFEDNEIRGPGNRQYRVLRAIFLYNEGVEKHSRFSGALPFNFSFDDHRDGLRKKRLPDLT